jgi:hypothetical protein
VPRIDVAIGAAATLAAIAVGLAACRTQPTPPAGAEKHFVGSAACESCHQATFARWKDTLMAKVVQDPAAHPDAIVGDFSTPNPLVTFRKEDVTLTYGSKWKQRYFVKRGDDYFVFPAQWDVKNRVWSKYNPGPPTRCSVPPGRSATAATR